MVRRQVMSLLMATTKTFLNCRRAVSGAFQTSVNVVDAQAARTNAAATTIVPVERCIGGLRVAGSLWPVSGPPRWPRGLRDPRSADIHQAKRPDRTRRGGGHGPTRAPGHVGTGATDPRRIRPRNTGRLGHHSTLPAGGRVPWVCQGSGPPEPPKPRLLDRVRHAIEARRYSRRTEKAYVHWIKRYIFFHGKRHPAEMGAAEVAAFLTSLAVQGKVAASTQNQALSALLFLYREVLGIDLPWFDEVVRAPSGPCICPWS